MRGSIICCLALILAADGGVFAAEELTAESGSPPGHSAKSGVYSGSTVACGAGTVESIDRNGDRIVIRDARGQTQEFRINQGTHFISNGSKMVFSDINIGDAVRFDSDPSGDILNFEFGESLKN
jgi:hypothetical protein